MITLKVWDSELKDLSLPVISPPMAYLLGRTSKRKGRVSEDLCLECGKVFQVEF